MEKTDKGSALLHEPGELVYAEFRVPIELRRILDAVVVERFRQINSEGFAPVIDDLGEAGRLATAASCYAITAGVELRVAAHTGVTLAEVWDKSGAPRPKSWPLSEQFWKPRGPRHNLVRAAALIFAELERMDRLGITTENGEPS